ncbi:MAG TPA: HDOD domain-containing protein [Rhodocyclaceae bacterium]|nr:HDOD domain-containing protein [Rhodocyclaceae bacterium]
MIEHPLADLDAWVDYFTQAELPVLRHTLTALDKLRANAENASGRVLSAVILQDPLMTLRVLAFLEKRRRKSQNADITTIGRALMMIGVNPFFSAFENLPLVEDSLKPHPQALLGLLKVIARARKASHWAREWAIARHDLNVEEITVATLLHEVTEILMWCFAPSLALKVNGLQAQDGKQRSADAQEEVYGVRLEDLTRKLARGWQLPQLLVDLMDRDNAEQPRVLNVTLAIDLARHSAHGWSNPALPDDMRAIENLLHISHNALLARLGLDVPEPPPAAAKDSSAG